MKGKGVIHTSNDVHMHHAHPQVIASDPSIDATGYDLVL